MKIFLENLNASTLSAYESRPRLIAEHHGIEETVLAGGYGYRQILELVQNGADAILEANEQGLIHPYGNRIEVKMRGSSLYVANTGAALTEDGLDALLSSHTSPKRGNQIGRFGLGFKSLLRLGGKIDVFTKSSGAIRFDPETCQRMIREQFLVKDAPGLRLAWPLDSGEAARDPILSALNWAETIVRVDIQAPEYIEHLRDEIQQFPREFLLFLANAVTLQLDDGVDPPRLLDVEQDGNERVIRCGEERSRWRVIFQDVIVTDPGARADATHIHARESVPLAWAIPVDGKRDDAGRFWAFFPTHTPTYLPGILNAPWKLNSDRNAIIGGEWNTVLMKEAAKMIIEALPDFFTKEDPGRALDVFPRQLDRIDEDAAPLILAVWKGLETAEVIPDALGILKQACGLWRHPRDNPDLARAWQDLSAKDELGGMVHPSCLERQRGSRLNYLAERLKKSAAADSGGALLQKRDSSSWFAAVSSTDKDLALCGLKLAEDYEKDCKPAEWNLVRPELAIIPTNGNRLCKVSEVVFAPAGSAIPGRASVLQALCEDIDAMRILTDVMKVSALDDAIWLKLVQEALGNIRRWNPEGDGPGWSTFWIRLRAAPELVRNMFVATNSTKIRVLRNDGNWVHSCEVILPGGLVESDDETSNKLVLVDSGKHKNDNDLLAKLGVVTIPSVGTTPAAYSQILSDWQEACRHQYKNTHDNAARWDYLAPSDFIMPWGWKLLPLLSGRPNSKLTRQFLEIFAAASFPDDVDFGHSTTASYTRIKVLNPLPWLLLKYGTVRVGDEIVSLAALVARRNEPAMTMIQGWLDLFPALPRLARASNGFPGTADDFGALWKSLIALRVTPTALHDDSLHDLWAGAAKDEIIPEQLPSETGEIPLARILVTGSPDLARRARTTERIVVTLDDETLNLWLKKGARNLADLVDAKWSELCGPEDLAISVIPELTDVLLEEVKTTARCQPVSNLMLNIEVTSEKIPCLMWQNTLLLDSVQLAQLSRVKRFEHLVNEVGAAGWLRFSNVEALNRLGDAKVDERRAMIAAAATLPERLLLAVGERRGPLLDVLGALADKDFIQQCTALQLAELCLAHHGPATLFVLKGTLSEEGLNPPSRWTDNEARPFVASIGFPPEFAVSPTKRRLAEERISGPIHLPNLHDFQIEVFGGIQTLVTSSTTRRRGVVSLPTGGGKTRVTVEAAVLLVLKPEVEQRSVIWIAQTDELCEQAVQAFRQVWLNLGAQRTDLRIVRLWGSNPNPAHQDPGKPMVVVSSIQTMNSRMGADGLDWLREPGLVVVDECHHAITPSYTNLLRWLDAEAPRPGALEKSEPVIIGLSATPFRTDDEESERLARRFDSRWFPSGQEQLQVRLRAQGVLSEVDYQPLDSGVGLLPSEEEKLEALWDDREGLDFDRLIEEINQRLAGNQQRNERLADFLQSVSEQSILFFANSVSHSVEMSARLNLAGIPSAAVSGETPKVARRYFLEKFQAGEIRVLCNHSVLTTGFDAPKTDMVLISRQVFSPVRYMQMVGRGLRGEKNGGTARCRMVTVVDNLGRFQDRHPYHYCQKYFTM